MARAHRRPPGDRTRRLAQLWAMGLIAALALPVSVAAEVPLVAAASSIKFALDDIAKRYADDTGETVRISYGSSGNFTRQILQGAPFEIFLSADESYVLSLAERGRTLDKGRVYALGRLVLFARNGSPLNPVQGLGGLASTPMGRIAIANPEHAPYGRAAREALQSAGVWECVAGNLVLGENAGQAARFALSGGTDGAILPYSLVITTDLGQRGRYRVVPDSLHQPLRHRMALLRAAGPRASQFYQYLSGAAARAAFQRHGFGLPGT